jgi:prophage regulatory protein
MISIIPTKTVIALRGRSRSSHYLDGQKGLFTHPIKIGERSSGYPETEVKILMHAYISGQSLECIKQLVLDLVAARQNAGGAV